MTGIKLPKKISPCPISEAVVEIRFESPFPADAIYGVIYKTFIEDFPKTQNLPILQLPEPIRLQDPALLYKPYYRLTNSGFMFQVGPKVCSLVNKKEYTGWTKFSGKIESCFRRLFKLGIIEKITRLGIRYINFFEADDIFDKINLKIFMGEEIFKSDETIIRTSLKSKKFTSNLQISNNGISKQGINISKGSIIDIDVFTTDIKENIKSEIKDLIEEGHYEEKRLFFSLLKEDFLKTLNPEY